MLPQKSNTVVNLYGLRAGLSVISKEKDAIAAVETRAKQVREKLDSEKSERDEMEYNLNRIFSTASNNASDDAGKLVWSVPLFVVSLISFIIFISNFLRLKVIYSESFNYDVYICGAFLAFALTCIILSILLATDILDIDNDFLHYFVPIVAIISGIITIGIFLESNDTYGKGNCYCGLLFAGTVFCGLWTAIFFILTVIHMVKAIGYKSKAVSAQIKLKKLLKINGIKDAEGEEELKKLALWRVQSLRPHLVNIENMYAVLRRSYLPIIDERDWRYLDLIIYQIETRRADTIKEALQLVDRELQTQRIENMITGATNYIVGTMKQGFAMLQNTLVQVYEGLSNQLSNISSQLATLNNNVCASAAMNAALMQKANVTSEALVNDLHSIRSNSEYMTSVLRRNS